jgi:hypothetical protein
MMLRSYDDGVRPVTRRRIAASALGFATGLVAGLAAAQPAPDGNRQAAPSTQDVKREAPATPEVPAAGDVKPETTPTAPEGKPSPSPSPPTPAGKQAPAGPPPEANRDAVGDDWVEISLVTDAPGVMLYAKDPRKVTIGNEVADSWIWTCNAPCDERVDPRRTYRVMGDGIIPSIEFHLAPHAGRVALQVSPARQSSRTIAGVLAALGATSALAGVLSLLVDVAERGAAGAVPSGSMDAQAKLLSSATSYENIGIGFLVVGAAMEVGSLVFLLTSKTGLAPAASHPSGAAPPRGNQTGGIRFIPGGVAF